MHYKKPWRSVVTLAITFLLSLASAQAEEKKADAYDSLTVAKIGDKEIKFAELNKMIKMMPPSYKSMFSNIEQMKKLLDVQINSILFSQEAKRLKLDQKPMVKESIEEINNRILMKALIDEKVNKNITVTDKEVEEYYKNNQDEFKLPEKVKVSHILIKVDPKATEKVKEEKKAKAEEILAKAKAGEDFSALAKQYSEDKKTVHITVDKDFGELAIVYEMPHSGILRLVNIAARRQATVCLAVLSLYGEELQSGAIVTAEPGRLRIRPPQNGWSPPLL